ncbi:MAG: peptidylprolyl isomerase [Cyanobacteriota bacterium]
MRQKMGRWLALLSLVGLVFVVGCSGAATNSADAGAVPGESAIAQSPDLTPAPSPTVPYANLARLDGEATVEIRVKGSPIEIQVNGNDAPITAGNFVDLVNRGVYDGLMFHRVVRQPEPFVVQGGDPQSKDASVPLGMLGTGSFVDPATSSPRYIPLEIKPEGAAEPVYGKTLEPGVAPVLKHTRGAVAMARSQFPDSASSQFYFTLADLGFLDGQYAVFGYVTSGMDVVDEIQQGDRIETARVTAGLENLKTGG